MSYVKVTVFDPEGNEHEAEVDPHASRESIARDLAEDLGLSPAEGYQIRGRDRIREGSTLILDKIPGRSARIL